MRRLRSRLIYANVIASIALLAFAGYAQAATVTVGASFTGKLLLDSAKAPAASSLWRGSTLVGDPGSSRRHRHSLAAWPGERSPRLLPERAPQKLRRHLHRHCLEARPSDAAKLSAIFGEDAEELAAAA